MTTAPEAEQATDRPLDEAGAAGPLDGNLSRRRMMRNAALTAGTVVAAGAGLAACSSGSPSSSGSGSSGSGSGSGSGSSSGGDTVLGKATDIPVGGGVIYNDDKVVVTQPTAGTYKAFSSTCTHLGCTVNKVTDGLIECPCHGSKFSIADGGVKGGPAPKSLPTENVTVKNGNIVLSS